METLREPPSVQRKMVSTPRSGGECSPRKPEPQPGNSTWRQSPVARPERPSALPPCNHREVESGDDVSSGSEDEQDRLEEGLTTLVRPASSQGGDRRVMDRAHLRQSGGGRDTPRGRGVKNG